MSSTLIELPPELGDEETSTVEYVEAGSLDELTEQTHIEDEEILERVLLRGQEFGPYRILGFVAAGGMGEIYAAERRGDDGKRRHPVALKVISPEHVHDWRILERFKREASISKAISSDNVIRVYEYGETEDDKAFLSMELLSGEELFERLCRVRTLPLDDLADTVLQVLNGLYDIHRSGFIHRDIKPENVFLARRADGNEIAKILDFGIAKRREEASDPLLSVAGQIYGTPEYLAPEQAINPDVDPRADLYSVGVMLYEAASGSLPFQGDTSYSVIASHQNDPVPPLPSSIDPAFAEIVYTALAKNPDDRFQTAAEMAQMLARWREQTSWVEELPGSDDLAFDDVFDTQDLSPARLKTHVDDAPAPTDDVPTRKVEVDEDLADDDEAEFYVAKRTAPSAARKRASTDPSPEDFDRDAAPDDRRRDQVTPQDQTAPPSASPAKGPPRTVDPNQPTEGSRTAQLITWLAVAAIIAALVWTVLQMM